MERKMLDDDQLVAAVAATFTRRKTPLPTSIPPALSGEFASDVGKTKQWLAFCSRAAITDAPGLGVVVAAIAPKLMDAARVAAGRGDHR